MCFRRLPYPEEKVNYTQTIDNIDVDTIINTWIINYFVPIEYREWWRNTIIITVTNEINYPAQTWGGHLDIRPEYLNCGVIAHEQAHISYSLLTNEEKLEFSIIYNKEKSSPLIKLLYSKNKYGLTNDIEGHAEVYRYLGGKMPETLKKYYPKLF